jgi:hypothetical protein
MDVRQNFQSISNELNALKNTIRILMGGETHWLTDGEHKEAILRKILRRFLPESIGISRGFIQSEKGLSNQMDIILYDNRFPTLFKDGELVFITSDAVKAIIEVKTKIRDLAHFKTTIKKLSENAEIVNNKGQKKFVGLFSFEYDGGTRNWYDCLKEVTEGNRDKVITHLCLGSSEFIRYWPNDPISHETLKKWRHYELNDITFGYFINNIISHVSYKSVKNNYLSWFPEESKEKYAVGEISLI